MTGFPSRNQFSLKSYNHRFIFILGKMAPKPRQLKAYPTSKAMQQIIKIRKDSHLFFPDLPGINLSDKEKKIAILISYVDALPDFSKYYEHFITAYNKGLKNRYLKFVDFEENSPFTTECPVETKPFRLVFKELLCHYDNDCELIFEQFIAGMVILSTVKQFKSQEQMIEFFKKRFGTMFYMYRFYPYDVFDKLGDFHTWNLLRSYTATQLSLKPCMMLCLIKTLNSTVTHKWRYIYLMALGSERLILHIADEFLKSNEIHLKGVLGVLPQIKEFMKWRGKIELADIKQSTDIWFIGQREWGCSVNKLRPFYTLVVNWKKSEEKEFKYPGFKDYTHYEKWKIEIDNRLVNKSKFDGIFKNIEKWKSELTYNNNPLVASMTEFYKSEYNKKPVVLSDVEWVNIVNVSELLYEIHTNGGASHEKKIAYALEDDFLDKVCSKYTIPKAEIDKSTLISVKLAKFQYDFDKKNHDKFVVKYIAKNPNLNADLLEVGLQIAPSAIEDDLHRLINEINVYFV